jgi:hypothetical protein
LVRYDRPNRNRLKYVLDNVPPGFLVDSKWLASSEVAKSSANDYHRQGWLERVTRGVYRRPTAQREPGQAIDWRTAVLSAQWLMAYDFHVGGVTALTLEGHNHYLELGRNPDVFCYGNAPNWLLKLNVDATFLPRRRQLFGGEPLGVEDRDFSPSATDAPAPWNWPLRRSSPERAVLEALNELPDKASFHKMDMLFQGLTTLRPARLTNLLIACKSVKVRRLFLLFADRHRHSWSAHVDRDKVDLGKGPRSLVQGGRYAAAYQLVVPEEFADAERVVGGADA